MDGNIAWMFLKVIYTTFLGGVAFLRLRKALNITMSQA